MKMIRRRISHFVFGQSGTMKHWHKISILLIFYDAIVSAIAYFLALWLRFDLKFSLIPFWYTDAWLHFTPFYIVITLVVFHFCNMYKSIWRFASVNELFKLIEANLITGILHTILITVFYVRMPISYYLFGCFLQMGATMTIRFSYRVLLIMRSFMEKRPYEKVKRVMIIGAGAAGQMILRDLKVSNKTTDKVICIIDDNSNKWGRYIQGVQVVGGRDDILVAVEHYQIDSIYFAIPTASAEDRRDILNICKEAGCELKTLPGLYQIINGEVSLKHMKDVAIEDLLGRDSIKVDMTEIFDFLSGKTILVTGGGGSIGSEICRQIARHNPKQLIIFDVYENNAYEIEQELRRSYKELDLVVLIGSVRDSRRISQVFAEYRPEIVFHAAAHKHVPLMETSPNESIKNNAIGTYKTAYAAMQYGCKRFVLISTDKAVNPTNIMGASKRICEMVIQSFDRKIKDHKETELPVLYAHSDDENGDMQRRQSILDAKTEFVAVRFGNVLGSNGSVIPLFRKQIAEGGPVTVTHPDIIRYFMTIPEAVSLVLQAGTYARGGEIFVLDMGAPVKIDTLARNLIKLSGFKPDVDIKIIYTGLRQGEKLYEEKLMKEEGMKTTPNKLIHIGKPIDFDVDTFLIKLNQLMKASYENAPDIRERVMDIVDTYKPTNI